jgi:putative DNA primase/helicase
MRGMRLVSAQESREGAAAAENIMKALTGGDKIRARRLYENSSEFDPTWKIWLAANHKPLIKGTDTAIWSRIKLVPFSVSFADREDKTLKTTLETELPGILAWAVEGCLRWQEEGLAFPASVTVATDAYRLESDQIGRFIDESCILGLYATARARDLYSAYHKWGKGAGEDAMSEIAFGRRLVERELTKRRTAAGFSYDGIGLRVDSDVPPEP